MQAVADRDQGMASPPRAHSLIHKPAALANPQTIGERIAARRQALKLTQAQVAEMVHLTQQSTSRKDSSTKPGWTPKEAGDIRTLSRTAYNMYESNSVKPVLAVLEQIARALRTSPEYIAFGVGTPDPIEQIAFNGQIDEFEPISLWSLPADWVHERFGAEPYALALAAINDFSPSLRPGDMAVVKRGVEPNAAGGEFVYGMNGEMQVAHLTRPARGGPYRVYDADRKTHTDVDPGEINILGSVVGKIGEL